MGMRNVTDFYIYRWRYPIGYTLFALSMMTFLVLAGLFIPGGLSEYEIASALTSDKLNPNLLFALQPDQLLFLPYRLLQAASFALFGFTSFSIKLPSLILAALSAGGILLLLGLWFKRNVAIIASIIAVTMGQFLLVAQSGHAGITYIFWAVCVLLTASLIIKQGKLASIWVVIGFMLAGLSLYMPLNIYVILALMATAIFHPHARHIVMRETSKIPLVIGSVLFLLIISPLVIGIIRDISLLPTLLGIPTEWSSIGENAKDLFQQYVGVYSPDNGLTLQPVYSLGILLLIGLGLYQMFTTKYTTKSYIISFWLILLLPFVVLNPSMVSITFVPVVLLMALGLDYLIRSWYRLFPRNPYARVFGLLPLGVLVVGIVFSNVNRYAYGFHYDKDAYIDYNYDLPLLTNELKRLPDDSQVVLVTSVFEKPFFAAFARHQDYVEQLIVKASAHRLPGDTDLTMATLAAKRKIQTPVAGIVAFKTAENADRFYLYKNTSN